MPVHELFYKLLLVIASKNIANGLVITELNQDTPSKLITNHINIVKLIIAPNSPANFAKNKWFTGTSPSCDIKNVAWK